VSTIQSHHLEVSALLDEPAVDASLTQREREVRESVRAVVARDIVAGATELDRDHRFAHEGVQALSAAGLGGLLFPETYGGTNDSNVAYALAIEEIAAACPSTSLVFMTQMHAAYPIYQVGSDALRDRYVASLVAGDTYGSLGVTEPNAGSDVSSLSTTARRVDGGWSVSGQKTFITTGDRADVIICFATIDKSLGRDGVTAFVIEGDWPGVHRGRPFDKLGMHGSTTAELVFDEVRVPDENVLGEVGKGWSVVMGSVGKSRISAAAQGIGIARAAYAHALTALVRRHGTRLPDDVTFALADLRGRIVQGRLLLHSVARLIDADPTTSTAQIGMMKQGCTDLGWRACVEATGLLGPHGDLEAHQIERFLRDAKVTQIYDGTNEIQRLLIGRETNRSAAFLTHHLES
jgi:alkylation response protein AidB-like acyl-CoA dehydrogenase